MSHLEAEVDRCHARSRAALDRLDPDAYLEMMAHDLVLIDHRGRQHTRAYLEKQTRQAFQLFSRVESRFERQSFEPSEQGAVEVVRQWVQCFSRHFWLLEREVRIERLSRLEWRRCDDEQLRVGRIMWLTQEQTTQWKVIY